MAEESNQGAPPCGDDPRAVVLGKMAKLALLKATLKSVLAPYEQQIAEIQKGARDATLAELREVELLEDEIKKIAAEDPEAVFGEDSRTLKLNQLALGARITDKVELLVPEDDIFSALEKLALSKDPAQKLAANACMRVTKEINRTFVREQYEANPEWFEALGLTVKECTSISLTEMKPPKTRVTREKKKGETSTGDTESA